jgi:regulatory protein
MPTIIHMEFKRRRPERFIVYLDDGEGYTFSPETVLKHALTPGKVLTENEFAHIRSEDDIRRAKDQILSYLSRRPHSRMELFRKTIQRGHNSDAINAALNDLEKIGLVDDIAFAHQFIQYEMAMRPCGKNLLINKLLKCGIDRELILPIVEQYINDEHPEAVTANAIAEKFLQRNKQQPPQKLREKLIRHLYAKGFDWSIIQQILADNANNFTDDPTDDEFYETS